MSFTAATMFLYGDNIMVYMLKKMSSIDVRCYISNVTLYVFMVALSESQGEGCMTCFYA